MQPPGEVPLSNILFGEDLIPAVAKVMAKGRPARAAAPYWGHQAVQALSLGSGDLAGRLEILCNLFAPTTDTDVISGLLARGAKAWTRSDLHAKAYFNQAEAIVGSVNASGAGFGISSHPLQELCVRIRDAPSIAGLNDWWALQCEGATPLIFGTKATEAALAHAKYVKSLHDTAQDLLVALAADPAHFRDVHVALDWRSYSSEVGKRVKELNSIIPGLDYDAWVDWPQMPEGAEVISFASSSPKKPVEYFGTWRTPAGEAAVPDDLKAVYVTRLPGVRGYPFATADSKWLNAATRYRADQIADGAKDGASMKLLAFAEEYLGLRR